MESRRVDIFNEFEKNIPGNGLYSYNHRCIRVFNSFENPNYFPCPWKLKFYCEHAYSPCSQNYSVSGNNMKKKTSLLINNVISQMNMAINA